VAISRRRISDFKPLFSNLAQTSHYQVLFGGLSSNLQGYLSSRGVDSRFVAESAGLLCFSASLPGSSFATADINGNFTGVSEKMAHTRMFTQISLDFYVDSEYKELKFLEHWIEFIASGSNVSQERDGYFFRMKYPNEYKSNFTKIIKFDRDYLTQIEYNFYGLFPLALDAVPVSYQGSEILKATATFNFDRYVCGKTYSVDVSRRINNNIQSNQNQNQNQQSTNTTQRLIPRSPGSIPSGGVELFAEGQTLYESLYGRR
jgi:hypothetical protein